MVNLCLGINKEWPQNKLVGMTIRLELCEKKSAFLTGEIKLRRLQSFNGNLVK